MNSAADREHKLFRLGVVSAALLMLVLLWPAVYGGLHTMHDMGDWYIPMRYFFAQCLATGDSPEWVPNVFCGYYLHGDGQVGLYHPYHDFLYRFLPFSLAIQLEMSVSFLMMCIGTFFLGRRFGLGRGVALFGGVAVAFSGYHFQHFEHMNAIQVLAHVPLLTLCVDIVLRSPSGRNAGWAALGVAALTTSELLIGYPQYFWFSSLWEGVYALLLILSPSVHTHFGRVFGLAVAKGVGVMGGAVQLLPTADMLSTSLREEMSRDDRAQWAWHPFEWTTLVAPHLFRAKSLATFYPGVVSVVLVAWLFLRHGVRVVWQNVGMRVALLLGVITMILAMGRLGLLYELHLEAPLIGVFRMPYRYLSLTSLAVGLLAAFALRELHRDSEVARELAVEGKVVPERRPWLFALPVLGVLSIAGVAWLDAADRSFYVERHLGSYPLAMLGVVVLVGVIVLVRQMERGRLVRSGSLVLFAVMAIDLGGYGAEWVYRGHGAPVTLEEYRGAVPRPPADVAGYRASVAVQNQQIFHGVSMPHGYMPMLPDAPLLWEIDERGERNETLLRLAGVKYLQDEEGGSHWTQVSGHVDLLRAQSRTWVEVEGPLPRARLVPKVLHVEATDDDDNGARLAVEASKAVDPWTTAVVEVRLPDLETGNLDPGVVSVMADRPGQIDLEVQTPESRLLVVNERMRPGWNAYVDDRQVAVLRTYGTFLGCVVGPDTERVSFRFEPPSLRSGRWLSWMAVALMAFAAAIMVWVSKRR